MGFLEFLVRLFAALVWLLVKWVFRKLGALCAKFFQPFRRQKMPLEQPRPRLVWSQRLPEENRSRSKSGHLALAFSKPEEPVVVPAPPPAAVHAPVVGTRHPPVVGHAPFLSLGAAPSNRTPRKPTRPPSKVALASSNREVTGPRNKDRSHLTLVKK